MGLGSRQLTKGPGSGRLLGLRADYLEGWELFEGWAKGVLERLISMLPEHVTWNLSWALWKIENYRLP